MRKNGLQYSRSLRHSLQPALQTLVRDDRRQNEQTKGEEPEKGGSVHYLQSILVGGCHITLSCEGFATKRGRCQVISSTTMPMPWAFWCESQRTFMGSTTCCSITAIAALPVSRAYHLRVGTSVVSPQYATSHRALPGR